jgi:four helix bundle protein
MSDEYKKLEVWKLSILLVKDVYKLVKNFPNEEMFSLTKQIKNCAISIPSNIAEGSLRRSPKEFARFINISRGSLGEMETQLIIAKELDFITDSELVALSQPITRISKMLVSLRKSMENKEK